MCLVINGSAFWVSPQNTSSRISCLLSLFLWQRCIRHIGYMYIKATQGLRDDNQVRSCEESWWLRIPPFHFSHHVMIIKYGITQTSAACTQAQIIKSHGFSSVDHVPHQQSSCHATVAFHWVRIRKMVEMVYRHTCSFIITLINYCCNHPQTEAFRFPCFSRKGTLSAQLSGSSP